MCHTSIIVCRGCFIDPHSCAWEIVHKYHWWAWGIFDKLPQLSMVSPFPSHTSKGFQGLLHYSWEMLQVSILVHRRCFRLPYCFMGDISGISVGFWELFHRVSQCCIGDVSSFLSWAWKKVHPFIGVGVVHPVTAVQRKCLTASSLYVGDASYFPTCAWGMFQSLGAVPWKCSNSSHFVCFSLWELYHGNVVIVLILYVSVFGSCTMEM